MGAAAEVEGAAEASAPRPAEVAEVPPAEAEAGAAEEERPVPEHASSTSARR